MSSKAADAARDRCIQTVLGALNEGLASLNLSDFCLKHNINYKTADGACRRLAAAEYVLIKDNNQEYYSLTPEAMSYLENGSPEFQFLKHVDEAGKSMGDLKSECGDFFKLGMSKCMMHRWITKDKKTGLLRRLVGDVEDTVTDQLREIHETKIEQHVDQYRGAKHLKDLKKRKLITVSKLRSMSVVKGPRFSTNFRPQVADLTKEMLDGDAWKNYDFRPANLKTFGHDLHGGFLHPLMKVRTEFRNILLCMG
jgi:phenylalanyl-tRNA synthetase alpha chain